MIDRGHCSVSTGSAARGCAARNRRGSTSARSAAARSAPGRQRAEGVARGRAAARAARSMSRSPGCPAPSSMALEDAVATQGRPSRQGVHQPHDSWAKNCCRLRDHADRAGRVVQHDHRAGAQAAAGLLRPSRSPSARRGAPGRRKSVEAPPGRRPRSCQPSRMPPACSSRISRSGGAHRQLPQARALHPAARAVELGAAVRACGSGP